ncbi:hypothetical protein RND81_05G091000 [Saponaria officinalis]|uniref:Scarecrow-like protein 8 n=1 Tax=Saponaria officinalis TaxID=3572 RepID=A0AAW1KVX6_SAPOF
MTSGYPGDFVYGGGGSGSGSGGGGTPGVPYEFRQQQRGMVLPDQIGQQRRVDLLMGKRSFADYQLLQQQQSHKQQQQQFQQRQQQQQQQTFSYLQKLQQQQQSMMMSQNPYLIRSIKQRTNGFSSSSISPLSSTIDLSSPNFNNNIINNNINMNNNNNNSCSTRFGVPVYQQPRQQQIPSLLNTYQFTNNPTQFNPPINSFISTTNQMLNPGQTAGFGYLNPVQNSVVPKTEPEDQKMLSTLQELEKHLLDDDDDDYDVTNQKDNDAVSGVTNSEWSDTFQDLLDPSPSPNPNPSPDPAQVCSSTICSNTTTSNNVISLSPSSSTSSCCSVSASASTVPVSAKQLIVEAATAISEGRNDAAVTEILSKLDQISDCKGNSEQRMGYYICNALRSRAFPSEHAPPVTAFSGGDQTAAMYTLYDISPCFKFGLLAANLVMLEAITKATQEGLKIHVIDFDVRNGAQYVNLLRALGERKAHAPSVMLKITVVETELGDKGGALECVKDELVGLAKRVGIDFNYSCSTRSIHELTRESLGCEEREAVVVNFAFRVYRVPDESVSMENLRDELLRRVKGLSPRAVTLVEQDMNGNTAPFMTRVNEACGYYGALFDSLEATLPRDNSDRCRVEDGLGRKMGNLIACEGRDRVERAEVFGKWRARMGMAGFELKPISQTVVESMRAKLNSTRGGNPGFTVKEENGGVGFGWMGRSLTAASAWR